MSPPAPRTPTALAAALADLAHALRRHARAAPAAPFEPVRAALRALNHELDAEALADTVAQLLTYSLLTARALHQARGSAAPFTASNARAALPVVNLPLLDALLDLGLSEAGRALLPPVDRLVALLAALDAETLQGDDPALRLYEPFLHAYAPARRSQRGVFYTPGEAVAYVVRGAHERVQGVLGLPNGLASTRSWGDLARPAPHGEEGPVVRILDPATGTGTFLCACVTLIERHLKGRWRAASDARGDPLEQEVAARWRAYVRGSLLERLHGVELMITPYAIAHLRLAWTLEQTGVRLRPDDRLRVHLGDALTEHAPTTGAPFTVIVGNPPWSGFSANMSPAARALVEPYKAIEDEPLGERRLWLQDDYVKFIRLAQLHVERAGLGVVGLITNHSHLDNPTFRGLRHSLMSTFPHLDLVDLHGSAHKPEPPPDGVEDQNLFPIRQGAAVTFAARPLEPDGRAVRHVDLWGARAHKLRWLARHDRDSTPWRPLSPDSPWFVFRPRDVTCRAEYRRWPSLTEWMPYHSAGFITARDHFVLDFAPEPLLERIARFRDPSITDAEARALWFRGRGARRYPDGDTRSWKLPEARAALQRDPDWRARPRRCLYRPFDHRWIYWSHDALDWPRPQLTAHLDAAPDNLALLTTRIARDPFAVFVTRLLPGHKSVSVYDVSYAFPLQLTPAPRANVSPRLLDALGADPVEVTRYALAVLSSPTYRERYAALLAMDFPRVPLPRDPALFQRLSALGARIAALHTLSDHLAPICAYVGPPAPTVERLEFADDAVWLDRERRAGFLGVPAAAWRWRIGGIPVCQRWLSDRRARGGRSPRPAWPLTEADLGHYAAVVTAVARLREVTAELDEVIEGSGGWPGAFAE